MFGKHNSNQSKDAKYSLADILSFPEKFLKDKIFKIEYNTDLSNSIHYVMLKVSKIKNSMVNDKSEKENA